LKTEGLNRVSNTSKNPLMRKDMTNIELDKINNPKEKQVLTLLQERKKCLYGNILKELSLSVIEGQNIIMPMLSKGLIRYQDHSNYLELNIKLQ
jgi:hypothetical protein